MFKATCTDPLCFRLLIHTRKDCANLRQAERAADAYQARVLARVLNTRWEV